MCKCAARLPWCSPLPGPTRGIPHGCTSVHGPTAFKRPASARQHRGTTSHPIDIPDSSFTLEFTPVPMANVASLIEKLSVSSPSVANPSTTAQIAASLLSWRIHPVGDIHDPVPSAGLYSNEYPDGDDGASKQVVLIVMSRTSLVPRSY